jgi:formate C-acetyltransferase
VLAAVNERHGAAMSLGRTSTWFDSFVEREVREGTLTESEAQELIDDVVIKLRIALPAHEGVRRAVLWALI